MANYKYYIGTQYIFLDPFQEIDTIDIFYFINKKTNHVLKRSFLLCCYFIIFSVVLNCIVPTYNITFVYCLGIIMQFINI